MRNVEKIKSLEHELGRYRKKVLDQEKLLDEKQKTIEEYIEGSQQTQANVDAIMTAVAIAHGVVAEDPDEPGKAIGWRLEFPLFDMEEMRAKYEIHARRDTDAGTYVLGVAPRAEE